MWNRRVHCEMNPESPQLPRPGGASQNISRGPARHERSPRTAASYRACPGGAPEENPATHAVHLPIFLPMPLRGTPPWRTSFRGLRSFLAGPRLISCGTPPGRGYSSGHLPAIQFDKSDLRRLRHELQFIPLLQLPQLERNFRALLPVELREFGDDLSCTHATQIRRTRASVQSVISHHSPSAPALP